MCTERENRTSIATGCSRKTVTSNISLTDLKITKNGVTQSLLESLYPTIYASSTCFMFKWPKMAQSGPNSQNGPKWPKVIQSGPKWTKVDQTAKVVQSGHFGPFLATLGHFGSLWAIFAVWATLGHFGPLWATLDVWATLGHF